MSWFVLLFATVLAWAGPGERPEDVEGLVRKDKAAQATAWIGVTLFATSSVWAVADTATGARNPSFGALGTAMFAAPLMAGGSMRSRALLERAGAVVPGRSGARWGWGMWTAALVVAPVGVGVGVATDDPAPLLAPLPFLAASYVASSAELGRNAAARHAWTRAAHVPKTGLWVSAALAGGSLALGLSARTTFDASKPVGPGRRAAVAMGLGATATGIGSVMALSGYLGAVTHSRRLGKAAGRVSWTLEPLATAGGGGVAVAGTW